MPRFAFLHNCFCDFRPFILAYKTPEQRPDYTRNILPGLGSRTQIDSGTADVFVILLSLPAHKHDISLTILRSGFWMVKAANCFKRF